MTRLQDYLTAAADREPARTALVMGEEAVSYGELELATNRLARLLEEQGCKVGSRVCLLTSKSPATIAGMLAVLKAGGVYVPIDGGTPAARIARILHSADPDLVLADPEAVPVIDALLTAGGFPADVRIGSVGEPLAGQRFESVFTFADTANLSAETVAPRGDPSDAAHLMFTSGSTGVPKGVVITHANVAAFVEWALSYFGTRPSDRISCHCPLHFDLSTFDIYGTLAAGAELHLVPAALSVNPHAVAALIRDCELTQWFSVPSVLAYMARFDVIKQGDFPALNRLLWCGEVLSTPVLSYWMKRLPHVRFTNLYGPTEATIASSYYTVPRCPTHDTEAIPIGSPCTGEALLVLDDRLQPVAPGETGELCIAGVGVSPGYWRDDEKTATVFLPDPRSPASGERIYRTGDLAYQREDGLFMFLGRADSQIKHRGYRIELGEIEVALNSVGGVSECAVVGVATGGFEGTAICCAYATRDGLELTPMDLRGALSELLPTYMLPRRWLRFPALPKNVSGKIDRAHLRELFTVELAAEKVEQMAGRAMP